MAKSVARHSFFKSQTLRSSGNCISCDSKVADRLLLFSLTKLLTCVPVFEGIGRLSRAEPTERRTAPEAPALGWQIDRRSASGWIGNFERTSAVHLEPGCRNWIVGAVPSARTGRFVPAVRSGDWPNTRHLVMDGSAHNSFVFECWR